MKIICLGDSLTYGCWDPRGGWVNQLRDYFNNYNITAKARQDRKWWWVFNLGVSGITSSFLADKISQGMIDTLRYKDEESIILVQIGKNDSYIIDKTGENYVPKDSFKNNLSTIYTSLKARNTTIIFLTTMHVDEKKLTPVPWVTEEDRSVSNDELSQFNDIIRNFCHENKVDYLDLEKLWTDSEKDNYLDSDGLHLNGIGHTKVFEYIRDYLLKLS